MAKAKTDRSTAGSGTLIGYARVSTVDQNPQLQLDALDRAGCARVFVDHASGSRTDRPELEDALEFVRAGDTLCIWKPDRLGRSLPHLIEIAGQLADRDIALRSLTEQIDTGSAGGRLIFHVFGALAEFERDLIRERTHAGLAAARARGRKGGRKTVMTPQKIRGKGNSARSERFTVRAPADATWDGLTGAYPRLWVLAGRPKVKAHAPWLRAWHGAVPGPT